MANEELGRRAAASLASAGERARGRADVPAAANLLERAISLLPERDPERVRLLPVYGAAVLDAGDYGRAEPILEEAISEARAVGDPRAEAAARLQRGYLQATNNPEWTFVDATRETFEAIAMLEAAGDHAGLAEAWHFVGLFEYWKGQCVRAQAAYDRSIKEAGLGQVERRTVPWWILAATYNGPTPATEAEPRIIQLAAEATDDRYIQALALVLRGTFAATQGRVEEARSLRDRGRDILLELGMRLHLAGTAQLLGQIEMLAGDHAAAKVPRRTSASAWMYRSSVASAASWMMRGSASSPVWARCMSRPGSTKALFGAPPGPDRPP